MSAFGKRWMIDGVPAGPINRHYPSNGQYTVIFEREYASLEQIESINWAKPTIQYIGAHGSESGLPEGYGFEVQKIDYTSGTKHYTVTLKTASQYLGDVTGYQDQIAELQTTVTDQASTIQTQEATIENQESTIQTQTATISEQECTIQEQASTIEGQAATIQELQEAGTAADLEAGLDAAYEEGVNSVE